MHACAHTYTNTHINTRMHAYHLHTNTYNTCEWENTVYHIHVYAHVPNTKSRWSGNRTLKACLTTRVWASVGYTVPLSFSVSASTAVEAMASQPSTNPERSIPRRFSNCLGVCGDSVEVCVPGMLPRARHSCCTGFRCGARLVVVAVKETRLNVFGSVARKELQGTALRAIMAPQSILERLWVRHDTCFMFTQTLYILCPQNGTISVRAFLCLT
jgi:hypothetical protein